MRAFMKWIEASSGAEPSAQPLQHRRRLQLALAMLVIALVVVVVRDIRDFTPPTVATSDPTNIAEPHDSPEAAISVPETKEKPSEPAPKRHLKKPSREIHARVQRPVVNASQSSPSTELSAGPTIVATDRAVLPPLEVEVMAGNQHRPLTSKKNSVDVEMQGDPPPDAARATEPKAPIETPPVKAQVSVSPDVAAHVAHSVAPNYPLLAKQMKVQGAVVLQALIDKGGKIQNLHVLSGPTILAAAAQEAVKQWRFKPYYLHGEAVETEARVSVNFTISTF